MEKWQRDHIQQNLRQLVDYTSASCDINFLLAFQEKELLTPEDVTSIDLIGNPYKKCRAFYELIQVKLNGYELLKAILKETKLTGALHILNQVNSKNASTPFKNFGTISYDRSKLIGRGSYNTKVFQGRFEKRDVAVKIINIEDVDVAIALKEINMLTNLDWHVNIVRYFKAEFTEDFVLIALELCQVDLDEFVKTAELQDNNAVNILKQITEGLIFLHSNKIVHRDLKPGNILISYHEEENIIVKLSDFGLSRKLQEGMSRITLSEAMGTPGWMAPEFIRQLYEEDNTKGKFYVRRAADIFSLGCIFYFVLTKGTHPFGKGMRREANILDGKSELDSGAIKTQEAFRAESFVWLINQMIKDNEKERPRANIILSHPALWERKKILKFFQDIYPYIDMYESVGIDDALCCITKTENWNWLEALDCELKKYLQSSVSGSRCSHLLKVIVEMQRAYSQLPEQVQKLLANSDKKYLTYWSNKFPFVLPLFWTIYQYSKHSASALLMYYPLGHHDFKFGFVGFQPTKFAADMLNQPANSKALLRFGKKSSSVVDQHVTHADKNDFTKFLTERTVTSENLALSEIETGAKSISVNPQNQKHTLLDGLHTFPNLPTNSVKRLIRGRHGLLTEQEFLKRVILDTTAIIICGYTGMGKTTLLTRLGKRILRFSPNRKLFYLKMKDIADAVKAVSKGNVVEKELVWRVLESLTGESKIGPANSKHNATSYSKTKIELFIDGFSNVNRDTACQILKCIHVCLIFASVSNRLWIAATPTNLEDIKKMVSIDEYYTIEPLDEAGQIEMITSYWERYISKDKQMLLEYARLCIIDLKSYDKYDLGNPLQCFIIAAACLGNEQFPHTKDTFLFQPQNILNLNNCYENLLLDAAFYRSFYTLELILNLNKFNIDCVNSYGNSPLFLSVYATGNVDCLPKLKMLIERGANVYHLNKINYNLLLFAASHASRECLNYILSLNKFDTKSTDIYGNTPLFLSVYATNNVDCLLKLKLLIDFGVRLKKENWGNYNLLLFAARYASVGSLNYILSLKHFNVNCQDAYGNTPLFLSIHETENVDCLLKLKLLLDSGANVYHLSKHNSDLLNTAAQFASADVLEYVLDFDTKKSDINNEDNDGETPLLLSVMQYEGIDCLRKLKLLLKHGADVNYLNKNKSNLLHYAAQYGSFDVLKYVISLGNFQLNSRDKFGQTALNYAMIMDNNQNVENVDIIQKVEFLTKEFRDFNLKE